MGLKRFHVALQTMWPATRRPRFNIRFMKSCYLLPNRHVIPTAPGRGQRRYPIQKLMFSRRVVALFAGLGTKNIPPPGLINSVRVPMSRPPLFRAQSWVWVSIVLFMSLCFLIHEMPSRKKLIAVRLASLGGCSTEKSVFYSCSKWKYFTYLYGLARFFLKVIIVFQAAIREIPNGRQTTISWTRWTHFAGQ